MRCSNIGPPGARTWFSVLDSQDSCCPLFLSRFVAGNAQELTWTSRRRPANVPYRLTGAPFEPHPCAGNPGLVLTELARVDSRYKPNRIRSSSDCQHRPCTQHACILARNRTARWKDLLARSLPRLRAIQANSGHFRNRVFGRAT